MVIPTKTHSKTPRKPPPEAAGDRSSGLAQLAIVILTIAALWPVCRNEFTTWDDYLNVAKNPWLNPVTAGGVFHFWKHPFAGLYIPLTYTVWGLLAAIAQVSPDPEGIALNPYIFHSANLLLHIAATLAAFQLLRLLTARVWAAAMGALLFALHPVQVEPVAWIAGLKDVLCGALSLVALWQYVLFARGIDAGPDRRPTLHYGAATAAFILAMLAKPSAMTVPLMALLLDRLFLGRPWKKLAWPIAPWLILAVGCAVVARIVQVVGSPPDGGRIWARPLLAGAALAFYLYKLLWPFRLAVIYRYSPNVLLAGHWIWFAWLVPAGVIFAAWMFRKRWPRLLGCLALSLAAVLPVLGLAPFQFEGHSLVADHYLYVAMIGPALALAGALASVRHPRTAAAICAIYLLGLGVCSFIQTAHWRNTTTLFTQELAVNADSSEGYNSLSIQAMGRRDFPLAEHLARESIRLQPDQVEAYLTLENILKIEGRTQEAIPILLHLRQTHPNHPGVLNDLSGILLAQAQGDPRKLAEAERLCRLSLEIEPTRASAHNNLALILANQGRVEEGLREAQRSVELDPQDAPAQVTLAQLLDHNHQHELAVRHAQLATQLDPNYVPARQLLEDLTHASR